MNLKQEIFYPKPHGSPNQEALELLALGILSPGIPETRWKSLMAQGHYFWLALPGPPGPWASPLGLVNLNVRSVLSTGETCQADRVLFLKVETQGDQGSVRFFEFFKNPNRGDYFLLGESGKENFSRGLPPEALARWQEELKFHLPPEGWGAKDRLVDLPFSQFWRTMEDWLNRGHRNLYYRFGRKDYWMVNQVFRDQVSPRVTGKELWFQRAGLKRTRDTA